MHSGEACPPGVGTVGRADLDRACAEMWLAGCKCAWAAAWAAGGHKFVARGVQKDAFRSGLLPGGVGCHSSCTRVGLAWRCKQHEGGVWEVTFRCDWH